ncbi:Multiple C2 and transmembrane domain-containing protein 1 [Hordeum vulgare]|nr:Multiple C2 and transmembrane domain-containing protein 1 [Hordeum vulgare]
MAGAACRGAPGRASGASLLPRTRRDELVDRVSAVFFTDHDADQLAGGVDPDVRRTEPRPSYNNAFVEVEFDGQRQRTATRPGDLSLHWNETLVFDVRDPARLSALTVDVSVQHDRSLNDHNALRPHAFLGRVRIFGDSVARSPDEAVVQRYPLDKRGLFSRMSRDIALRLYLVADARDDDRVAQDHDAPSVDTGRWNVFSGEAPAGASVASGAATAETKGKSGHDTREFRSIPASSGGGNQPRRHTLHAMAAPPAPAGQTMVVPKPAGPAQAPAPGSQYGQERRGERRGGGAGHRMRLVRSF